MNDSNVSTRKQNNSQKEMHKVVCSKCKKECEVPFKPMGDRPVYCKDCYNKNK
jgi:CxxC-x17-CxxC domain-containing protein